MFTMYVLEARDGNGKVVGRAEYDNGQLTNVYSRQFQRMPLVQSIRISEDDGEPKPLWERA